MMSFLKLYCLYTDPISNGFPHVNIIIPSLKFNFKSWDTYTYFYNKLGFLIILNFNKVFLNISIHNKFINSNNLFCNFMLYRYGQTLDVLMWLWHDILYLLTWNCNAFAKIFARICKFALVEFFCDQEKWVKNQ